MNCTNTKNVNVKTRSGLTYTILREGNGPVAKEGQEVVLIEKVKFLDGSLAFPNKVANPFKIILDKQNVIDGMREGVTGMKTGEIRVLTIPPSLSKRTPDSTFPYPDSTLVYEIELVEIAGTKP